LVRQNNKLDKTR